jgi:hypothetical protein
VSIVGIHATGDCLRLCGVSTDGALNFSENVEFARPISLTDLKSPEEILAPAISETIPDRDAPVCLALPGGAFQIRRVPLELAEDVDQRSQVTWEVQQTLSATDDEYSIDYLVRGSSAIWVAIPNVCIEALGKAMQACGLTVAGLCASPIAVAHAIRRHRPKGRTRGILVDAGWISVVDLEDRNLVSASAHCPREPEELTQAAVRRLEESDSAETYVLGDASVLDHIQGSQVGSINLLHPDTETNSDTLHSVAYGAALYILSGKTL